MRIDYRICSAAPRDAAEIAEIERQVFSVPWSRNLIEQEIANESAVFLAAKDETRILGYVSGQQIADEFYISNLAVAADCRGLGIGRTLMEQLIDIARLQNSAFISLEVRVSNAAARRLYESLGFQALGERKDYYQHPQENAVIYSLYFDHPEEANEDSCN